MSTEKPHLLRILKHRFMYCFGILFVNYFCSICALGQAIKSYAVRCHFADIQPAGTTDLNKWTQVSIELFTNQVQDSVFFIEQQVRPI